jgi:hypothetical protein
MEARNVAFIDPGKARTICAALTIFASNRCFSPSDRHISDMDRQLVKMYVNATATLQQSTLRSLTQSLRTQEDEVAQQFTSQLDQMVMYCAHVYAFIRTHT